MNRNQSIVLVIGVILFVFLVLTAPQYQLVQGNRYPPDTVSILSNQYDLGAAALRGIVVIAATVGAFLLFRSKQK